MGEGYFHNNGYDESRGGFSYGRLRMLHGGSYNAYFSDALLRAAWVEGNLGAVAREPKWWHRDDPGMAMTQSSVEIRCLNDSFEIVFPDDNEDVAMRASAALAKFPGADGERVHIEQAPVNGALVDREDRVQRCIQFVHHLYQANL